MLQSLALCDFVIVDHLELDFGSGFSVLTGETGAGKSILLDALALALGERADTSQIREGCQRAEISAIFQVEEHLQEEIAAWLHEADFPLEDDHRIVIKRSMDHSGRSKAYINGGTASLNQLRELGDRLVDIHGQHAHQLLLKTGAQRELLDRHANLHDQAAKVAQAYQLMNATSKQLQQAEAAGADLQREQERLQWQLDELNEIAPQAHEWGEIQTSHARLANAAKIIQGIELAIDHLSDAENSIESQLNRVQHTIDDLVKHDANLSEINESLSNAQIQIDEAIHGLNRYRQKNGFGSRSPCRARSPNAGSSYRGQKIQSQPRSVTRSLDQLSRKISSIHGSTRYRIPSSETQDSRVRFSKTCQGFINASSAGSDRARSSCQRRNAAPSNVGRSAASAS